MVKLTARTRRAGDRMTPRGAPGSKTLKRLYIDRKIPQPQRAELPLVCDEAGICWSAALGAAARAAADRGTVRFLEISVRRSKA